jgi:hypothetical protein
MSRSEVHLRQSVEVSSANYLRAAHAYILISMPTGTSTIFGAFQAILALSLQTGRTSALTIKLPRKEKFASEIFCYKPPRVILLQRDSALWNCLRLKDQPKRYRGVHHCPSGDLIERLRSSDLAASDLADCHLDVLREQRIKNL